MIVPVFLSKLHVLIILGIAKAGVKGHEPKSYETLLVIASLLFNFTIVNMRGLNKSLNIKKKIITLRLLFS